MENESFWTCKIGPVHPNKVPHERDEPMKKVVKRAFRDLFGYEAEISFTDWGGSLTPVEQKVLDEAREKRRGPTDERATMERLIAHNPHRERALRDIQGAVEVARVVAQEALCLIGLPWDNPDEPQATAERISESPAYLPRKQHAFNAVKALSFAKQVREVFYDFVNQEASPPWTGKA